MDCAKWQKISIFLNALGMNTREQRWRAGVEVRLFATLALRPFFSGQETGGDWANMKQMAPCTFISDGDYISLQWKGFDGSPSFPIPRFIHLHIHLAIYPRLWKHVGCFCFSLAARRIFCSAAVRLSSRWHRVWPSCTATTWPSLKWNMQSWTLLRYVPLLIIMVRKWNLFMSCSVPRCDEKCHRMFYTLAIFCFWLFSFLPW